MFTKSDLVHVLLRLTVCMSEVLTDRAEKLLLSGAAETRRNVFWEIAAPQGHVFCQQPIRQPTSDLTSFIYFGYVLPHGGPINR